MTSYTVGGKDDPPAESAKAEAWDEGEAELSKFGDSAELLDIAVEAGKLGLREGDLEPMARLWYMTRSRGVTEADIRDMHNIISRHQKVTP